MNGKLTLDMAANRLQNEESRRKSVEVVLSELVHLFRKCKKGKGEANLEIPVSKTIITPNEDLSPRRET